MEIFELAAALGQKLKEDERLVRLEKAHRAYEENEEVNTLSMEYAVQQQAIQNEAAKEDRDDAAIEQIEARIEELYNQITGLDVYKELEAAQEDVNALMEAVNNTISAQISGEEPGGCTHNCATCGGCH
jgi:cell fate (sporulation/competence/biofilm development) regulator YmcA (YheA/YmcA/DUF963 family)